MVRITTWSLCAALLGAWLVAGVAESATYGELRQAFTHPDHSRWGEVPLWWWEGAPMKRERVTAQLEELAAKGVRSVCPIQRSPGRCDPQSFEPAWWDLFAFVHEECRRLGMTLWAYDQVGYGHYGWLEKAAASVGDTGTARIEFRTSTGESGTVFRLTLPDGKLIGARAYPVGDGVADDAACLDVRSAVRGTTFEWKPPEGTWRIAISVAVPMQSFYLCRRAADTFLDQLYGKIERTVGKDAMGSSFAGVFQDEHPPTPRDVYTDELAQRFRAATGYDLERAIPALHFDVGPRTPRYRTDYFDVYLKLVEETYWKRIYDWTDERNVLTSHDNWGRNNIYRQSQGYIDYFRSQRWFSAPGYDDAGQRPLTGRNYYDTKIAASIARLYGRPRVWNEAFHSSGWGRTTDQTLVWLSTGMAFGANLYDEHGLYYATRASTWEHAAPDPHWRQPYWRYYKTLSDWVARTSYLMSQGTHVVDAAVHYPVVSLLAGEPPGVRGPDYNQYMTLSRAVFDAGVDNDIVDDGSILEGSIREGKLWLGGNGYQALIFGPETTARRAVLSQALALARSGGTVLFFGRLPAASTEVGREDAALTKLLTALVGVSTPPGDGKVVSRRFPGGGFCAFVPSRPERLPQLLTEHTTRDFIPAGGKVFVAHRRIGDVHVYLVQNAEGRPLELEGRFRVDAVPELWEPFTGEVLPVSSFSRGGDYTTVRHRLEGNTAQFIVFRPGPERRGGNRVSRIQPPPRALADAWSLSVIPTRDNRWGEFRWPPTREVVGPEVRTFRYRETDGREGLEARWQSPQLDDAAWPTFLYSTGPQWLYAGPLPEGASLPSELIQASESVVASRSVMIGGKALAWRELRFSKSIGTARAAPWGGHSGYPDGHVDKNFVHLPDGRKILFTRLRSPKPQRLGLRVELRNQMPRLWVNGEEQPFEDAVGSLPLLAGENTVLLDLPDGGHGRLFVQRIPPTVSSVAEAARGSVQPDLRRAAWIWAGDTAACYVRKRFSLSEEPAQARVIVSAFSGYRLFVNGQKIEEEIGPWSNWRKPETFTITPHLRRGENVLAVWGQLFAGQNVNKGDQAFRSRGIVLALAVEGRDGSERTVVTDGTWRGTVEDHEHWERSTFDDTAWKVVRVGGRMGDPPWGMDVVNNVGAVTEPRRPLSIHLPSPYLTCFDDVTEIVADVKPEKASRVGWFRFAAPPGLRTLTLPTRGKAKVWVDGQRAEVRDGKAFVTKPPRDVSTVAIRLEMVPGEYAGAAFSKPLAMILEGGRIRPGLWKDYALPTYSGIGVYTQKVLLTERDLAGKTTLDLGQVLVAAEVFVNGRPAGVRLARPFKFDLTGLLRAGDNVFEVRVANTIAPHYTTIPALNLGPTDSGLLGPVRLLRELSAREWKAWATGEEERLQRTLEHATPELRAAQKAWETGARWEILNPLPGESPADTPLRRFEDGSVVIGGPASSPSACTVAFPARLQGITGLRLELFGRDSRLGANALHALSVRAVPPEGAGVLGRFVRIEMIDRPEFLALAEVEVVSGGKNIARRGTARQSSTSHGGHARLAIDGNPDGRFFEGKSVTHTNPNPIPWWEVDLGTAAPIERIVIWNRTDGGLHTRLTGFQASVLDENRRVLWRRGVDDPPNPNLSLRVSGPALLTLRAVPAPKEGREARLAREKAVQFVAEGGWSVRAGDRARTAAIFETEMPLAGDSGTLELNFQRGEPRAKTRFRFSITRSAAPVCDIPLAVEGALKSSPEARTPQQRAALEKFYLSVAPSLDETRARLRQLEEDIQRLERPRRY